MIRRSFLLAFLVVLLSAGMLYAQAGATGTIHGTVTDPSGAVIPGAAVTVTNTSTAVATHASTSSTGNYSVPYLIPGTYIVSVTAKGFQKGVVNGIGLVVAQDAAVNLTLKPGSVSQSVEVQANAVQINTSNSAITQTITSKEVENLPMNGRNFVQLLTLGPTAVTVGGEQGTMRQGEGNAISINGGRPESNNYTLDGLANEDMSLNTPAVILSQDAIQEFKEQSGAYGAQYGFSANQVNLVSKSGGNNLHGSVFETLRNNSLDARNPFQSTLPELRQNQFGFVVSGPVVLPGYNGRNKTFFMANYEGWRIQNGFQSPTATPDPQQLLGNFANATYYDPTAKAYLPLPAYGSAQCTANLKINQPCMPIDPQTGQPFPGNVIPTSSFSKLATATNKLFFPAPNPSALLTGNNNLFLSGAFPLTSNQQTYRIDQNMGKWGSVFGRYTYSNYNNQSFGTATLGAGNRQFIQTEKDLGLSYTAILSPTMVNNVRFGYLGALANQGSTAPSASFISSLGLTGTFQNFGPMQASYPNIGLSQFSGFGGPVNSYTGSDQKLYEFADSLSMVHGNHTLSMGVDYRRYHLIRNLDDDFLGDYTFANNTILTNNQNCPTATGMCGTGNAIADYLLGYYSGVGGFMPAPLSPTTTAGNPQDHVFNYFAPYIQDDWKVNSRLTLNLGLRWDYRATPYEASNHFFWLDSSNPNGGLCFADKTLLTNGVAPQGNGVYRYCGSNVPMPGSKTPFAPRIGFAWRPFGNNTVVRGGWGIYYDSSEGREIDDSGDLYPYAVRQNLTPTSNPNVPKLTDQLFPSFTTLGPINPASLTFIAVIQSNHPKNPYVEEYSLSVQHQLAPNTVLSVDYTGNHGIHLLDRRDIAQALPITAANLAACQANPNDTTHDCPVSMRKPYANFPGIFINSSWNGFSNYNSGTIKLTHRASNLALQVFYTWARAMDIKSAAAAVGGTTTGWQGFMNNHQPQLDYGPSDYNVTNRFVTTYVYQLPIGKGRALLGNMGSLGNTLIGGWTLSGDATFQSGFPFSISATDIGGLNNTFFQRANLVSGCDPNSGFTKSISEQFNTACFTQPAAGVYGNSSRNYLNGPGIAILDTAISKTFQFNERTGLQIRVDTFNTLNHPQYGGTSNALVGFGSGGNFQPGASLGASNFGALTGAGPGREIQLGAKLTF